MTSNADLWLALVAEKIGTDNMRKSPKPTGQSRAKHSMEFEQGAAS